MSQLIKIHIGKRVNTRDVIAIKAKLLKIFPIGLANHRNILYFVSSLINKNILFEKPSLSYFSF